MSDQLHVDTQGEGAEAVVLLHGFGTTHRSWKEVIPLLAERARVYSFDLPGHGGSADYAGGISPRAASQAVAGGLRRLGLEKVHLAGHSMGGAIAALLVLMEPQLAASLTLLAPGGFGEEINHRLLARYAEARDREQLLQVLEVMSGWNHAISDGVIEDYLTMRAVPGQCERLVAMASGMARGGHQGVIPRESLAGIEVPVTLMWGLQDCVLPSRQASGVPENFRVHLLEKTGHMLPYEQPQEVARQILGNLP